MDVGASARLISGPGEWVMVSETSWWWFRWRDKDRFPGEHAWYIK